MIKIIFLFFIFFSYINIFAAINYFNSSKLCDITSIKITDNWKFIWNKFLTNEEISEIIQNKNTVYDSNVNFFWNKKDNNAGNWQGYATYITQIKQDKTDCSNFILNSQKYVAVHLQEAYTAYQMSIYNTDGEEIISKSSGIISTTSELYLPFLMPLTLIFPEQNNFWIVIKISNFDFAKGGIIHPPIYGLADKIELQNNIIFISHLLTLGIIIAIGFYLLIYFFLNNKDEISFWFALFCFYIAVRGLLISRILWILFANYPVFGIFYGLEIALLFMLPGIFVRYSALYMQCNIMEYYATIQRFLGLLLIIIFFITSPLTKDKLLWIWQIWLIISVPIYFIILLNKINFKNIGNYRYGIFVIIMYISIMIHDVLASRNMLEHDFYLLEYSFLFLCFWRAFVMAQNSHNSKIYSEKLLQLNTQALKYMQKTLFINNIIDKIIFITGNILIEFPSNIKTITTNIYVKAENNMKDFTNKQDYTKIEIIKQIESKEKQAKITVNTNLIISEEDKILINNFYNNAEIIKKDDTKAYFFNNNFYIIMFYDNLIVITEFKNINIQNVNKEIFIFTNTLIHYLYAEIQSVISMEKENVALKNNIFLAADISDKLNSPLVVLVHSLQKIFNLLYGLNIMNTVKEEDKNKLENNLNISKASLDKVLKLSSELSALREHTQEETTQLLKK